MRKIKEALFLLAMPFLFQGCVGYDRTLFVTKTNVGIDFRAEANPPLAPSRRGIGFASLLSVRTVPLLGGARGGLPGRAYA